MTCLEFKALKSGTCIYRDLDTNLIGIGENPIEAYDNLMIAIEEEEDCVELTKEELKELIAEHPFQYPEE